MKTLILIKHSTSNANADQPPSMWALTPNGERRAHALADHLAPYNPDHLAASHMPKAQQTAAVLSAHFGLNVQTVPALAEHARERNAPFFDDVADFKAAVHRVITHPDELAYGTETGNAARARFAGGIADIVVGGDTVAVVAHGTVITLFVAAHNPNVDAVALWEQLALPSFVVLDSSYRVQQVVGDAGVAP
jgi:broad specificity phosphatase PhoE